MAFTDEARRKSVEARRRRRDERLLQGAAVAWADAGAGQWPSPAQVREAAEVSPQTWWRATPASGDLLEHLTIQLWRTGGEVLGERVWPHEKWGTAPLHRLLAGMAYAADAMAREPGRLRSFPLAVEDPDFFAALCETDSILLFGLAFDAATKFADPPDVDLRAARVYLDAVLERGAEQLSHTGVLDAVFRSSSFWCGYTGDQVTVTHRSWEASHSIEMEGFFAGLASAGKFGALVAVATSLTEPEMMDPRQWVLVPTDYALEQLVIRALGDGARRKEALRYARELLPYCTVDYGGADDTGRRTRAVRHWVKREWAEAAAAATEALGYAVIPVLEVEYQFLLLAVIAVDSYTKLGWEDAAATIGQVIARGHSKGRSFLHEPELRHAAIPDPKLPNPDVPTLAQKLERLAAPNWQGEAENLVNALQASWTFNQRLEADADGVLQLVRGLRERAKELETIAALFEKMVEREERGSERRPPHS